jgi:hypothetical protein
MMGDVKIKLDGKEVALVCSLEAGMKIDQDIGGVVSAFRAVSQGNIGAIGDIIAAGTGMSNHEAREAAFRTGVSSLIDGVTEFVGLCAAGGRKPDPKAKEGAPKGEA